jgi:hypothetical protein
MMLRPIILKGESQYGVLRKFADEIFIEFKNMGMDSIQIDLCDKNCSRRIQEEFSKGCSFVVAFNGIGSDIKVGNELLYNVLNVPFIGVYVDNPYHHLERLSHQINNYLVTFVDKSHLELLNTIFPKNKFKIKSFCHMQAFNKIFLI